MGDIKRTCLAADFRLKEFFVYGEVKRTRLAAGFF